MKILMVLTSQDTLGNAGLLKFPEEKTAHASA
jgi:hypothetical protein